MDGWMDCCIAWSWLTMAALGKRKSLVRARNEWENLKKGECNARITEMAGIVGWAYRRWLSVDHVHKERCRKCYLPTYYHLPSTDSYTYLLALACRM